MRNENGTNSTRAPFVFTNKTALSALPEIRCGVAYNSNNYSLQLKAHLSKKKLNAKVLQYLEFHVERVRHQFAG